MLTNVLLPLNRKQPLRRSPSKLCRPFQQQQLEKSSPHPNKMELAAFVFVYYWFVFERNSSISSSSRSKHIAQMHRRNVGRMLLQTERYREIERCRNVVAAVQRRSSLNNSRPPIQQQQHNYTLHYIQEPTHSKYTNCVPHTCKYKSPQTFIIKKNTHTIIKHRNYYRQNITIHIQTVKTKQATL